MDGFFKRRWICQMAFWVVIHPCPHSTKQEHLIILDFQFLLQLTGFQICFTFSYNGGYSHRNCTIVEPIQCKCPSVSEREIVKNREEESVCKWWIFFWFSSTDFFIFCSWNHSLKWDSFWLCSLGFPLFAFLFHLH